jgi:hypothetical protein
MNIPKRCETGWIRTFMKHKFTPIPGDREGVVQAGSTILTKLFLIFGSLISSKYKVYWPLDLFVEKWMTSVWQCPAELSSKY